MTNIVTIKYYCNDCKMEFEVTYDDEKFDVPTHCVACGSDNDLTEKCDRK